MMDILRWLGLSWFFDFLPGVDLIPDRIRKIIAAAFFVPGAILTSIGWSMEQRCQQRVGGPNRITDDGARSIPDVHFLVSLALALRRGGVTDLELENLMTYVQIGHRP